MTTTEHENYLMVMSGKQPEWVPNFEDALDMIIPAPFLMHFMTEEKRDFFGVPWVIVDAGPMVDNHQPHVMDDINDWKKFVHLPDPASFPWEAMAAQQLAEEHDPNKALIVMPNLGGGTIFMPLINMMGFEDGLCSIMEEPEVAAEFFGAVTDFYVDCIPYIAKYYHPDTIIVGDDLCTADSQFITMDAFEEILKPLYQRQIDAVHREGVYAELHMCGKCEPFVHEFASMGADSWQPAQGMNDIAGIQAKYGKDLVINGGWRTDGPAWCPGASEDLVRSELRECFNAFADDSAYIFWTGGQVGFSEDQAARFGWVTDEARSYGRQFYKRHHHRSCRD